jgi:hypothetical protein
MLKAVEGVLKAGKVELKTPVEIDDGTPVIVTYESGAQYVNLAERGITREQAANLRWRLSSFAEEWDRTEMDIYDAL